MTTKQWLLGLIVKEEESFWARFREGDPDAIAHAIKMLANARRLVEQGPEEPTP